MLSSTPMVGIIAHAPVDVVIEADYAFLETFGLARHECTTMTRLARDGLAAAVESMPRVVLPGGCGANMASWLARLGSDTAVVAPFGQDANGAMARRDLESRGVRVAGFDYEGPHTLIYTLITPDRERTFAAWYHGVRYDITAAVQALRDEREVIVDGYLLFQPGVAEGLRAYLAERPAGQQVVFCPGDVSVLAEMAADARFVLERCDHLVMNRNEAAYLYPGLSSEAVAAELRARGVSGAITEGENGALLFNPAESLHIPPASLGEPVINTNGAGDAFTAGYVHGLDRGLTLAETAQFATSCAAEILMTHGARPEHVEDAVVA